MAHYAPKYKFSTFAFWHTVGVRHLGKLTIRRKKKYYQNTNFKSNILLFNLLIQMFSLQTRVYFRNIGCCLDMKLCYILFDFSAITDQCSMCAGVHLSMCVQHVNTGPFRNVNIPWIVKHDLQLHKYFPKSIELITKSKAHIQLQNWPISVFSDDNRLQALKIFQSRPCVLKIGPEVQNGRSREGEHQ